MTSLEDIAASYAAEKSYQWNLDDVIDSSDAVGAWGNKKESTTELADISENGNIGTIHGAMPSAGFIQGRRYDGDDDYIDCGNDSSLVGFSAFTFSALIYPLTISKTQMRIFDRTGGNYAFAVGNNINIWFGAWYGSAVNNIVLNKIQMVTIVYDGTNLSFYYNGEYTDKIGKTGDVGTGAGTLYMGSSVGAPHFYGHIINSQIFDNSSTASNVKSFFNTLARLPFWSVNFTDYPDNATEYNSGENLPYSSGVIL